MENTKIVEVIISVEICNQFRIEDYLLQLKIEWLAYQTQRYYIILNIN